MVDTSRVRAPVAHSDAPEHRRQLALAINSGLADLDVLRRAIDRIQFDLDRLFEFVGFVEFLITEDGDRIVTEDDDPISLEWDR